MTSGDWIGIGYAVGGGVYALGTVAYFEYARALGEGWANRGYDPRFDFLFFRLLAAPVWPAVLFGSVCVLLVRRAARRELARREHAAEIDRIVERELRVLK